MGSTLNIALLLPDVELRLGTFVVDKKARDINFHVIFSDSLPPEVIENEFLEPLEIEADGSISGLEGKRQLNEHSLREIGKAVKANHATFKDDGEITAALKNITVSLTQVQSLLRKSLFANKFLLVLAGSEWGDIDWNQAYLAKKNFLQAAHALDTANPKTISWALGKGPLSEEAFVREFGRLKPCIHGSDAHKIEDIAKPAGNRFCWIKADTTFEGLRQIVFEPEARAFIGENPPNLKHEHQIISSLTVNGREAWFTPDPIPLNRDLVAIIGGRGCGKSALAELIAFAGGSKVFDGQTDNPDAFLSKASERSETNPTPIIGAQVRLEWSDGAPQDVTIGKDLKTSVEDEKVKYLPQKFVERLCAPEGSDALQHEIERIIFNNLNASEQLEARNFADLRERATQHIRLRKSKVASSLSSLNRAIQEAADRISQAPALAKDLTARKADLDSLLKQAPSVPEEDKSAFERLEALTKERGDIEKRLAALNEQLEALNAIETRVELFGQEISAYNEEIKRLLDFAGLSASAEAFTVKAPVGTADVVVAKRSGLEDLANRLRKGTGADVRSLEMIDAEASEIRSRVQLGEVKRKEHEQYQRDKAKLELTVSGLEAQLKEIHDQVEPQMSKDIASRFERFADAIDLLREEQNVLQRLYKPLSESLAAADETARKLAFVSRVTFDVLGAALKLFEVFDGRSSLFAVEDIKKLLRSHFQSLEENGFEREAVIKTLQTLEVSLTTDGKRTRPIDSQLRRGRPRRDFDEWLFDPGWFSVSYALLFDGKELRLLSPGEKGIVLLLLYLEAEKEDTRPLIIDQPEDNLDNMSVYPALMKYFQKRKTLRQIIIITHNPNLVVNTDAEQVIVPNFDGAREPRIQYLGGSLENTHAHDPRGIRELVCKILEGGTEAFQRREQKYSLPG